MIFKNMKKFSYAILLAIIVIPYILWISSDDMAQAAPNVFNEYYVDATVESGATTTGGKRTAWDFVTLLNGKPGKLIFKNVKASGYTYYDFVTSRTIPNNVQLQFENGAMISGCTSGVTLPAPANIIAQPDQQIFGSGVSNIHFAAGGIFHPGWFNVNTTNTSAQNRSGVTALMQAISGVTATVQFGSGTYAIDQKFGVKSNTTVMFAGANKYGTILLYDYNVCGNIYGFASDDTSGGTSDRISVRALTMRMLNGVNTTGYAAIRIINNYCTVENVILDGWFSNGVIINGDVNGVNVGRGCRVHNCDFIGVKQYGIRVINCDFTQITNNFFHTTGTGSAIVMQGACAYWKIDGNQTYACPGIGLEDSEGNAPSNGSITNNFVSGTYGIFHDGAQRVGYITVQNNIINAITGGLSGIDFDYAYDCIFANNQIANITSQWGILVTGSGTSNASNNVFTGNSIYNVAQDSIKVTYGANNTYTGNVCNINSGYCFNLPDSAGYQPVGIDNVCISSVTGIVSTDDQVNVATGFTLSPPDTGRFAILSANASGTTAYSSTSTAISNGRMYGQRLIIINTNTQPIAIAHGANTRFSSGTTKYLTQGQMVEMLYEGWAFGDWIEIGNKQNGL